MEVRFRHMGSSHQVSFGRRGASRRIADEPTSGQRPAAPRSRRQGGSLQDQALYNCSCGYVFNAAVSTSVGCPHCGGTQAW